MKHDRATEDLQIRAAAYALGTMSQHEARVFEGHLNEGCAVCQAELQQFEKVTEQLGQAATSAKPPAYVRDLLLARVAREPRIPPAPGVLKVVPTPGKPADRPSRLRSYLPWALAASLAVVSLVAIMARYQAERERDSLAGKAIADQILVDQLKATVESDRRRREELEEVNTVLKTAGARRISMEGQPPAPSSSAEIFWDTQHSRWVVSANLPPAPPGKIYQLWFVTPAAKISAGLIRTDATGHAFEVLEVPRDIGKLAAAAITLEPAGGSAQPTMPIYTLGPIG